MVNKYYKKTKKSLEKKHLKGTKVFLSNKRTKAKKKNAWDRYKNLSEEDREERVSIIVIEIKIFLLKKKNESEYMRNYYLANKK